MYLAYLILEVFCRQSYMINGIGSKLCFCKEEMKTIDLELKHEAYMSVAEKIKIPVEKLRMNLEERECYDNEGANDMLDIVCNDSTD